MQNKLVVLIIDLYESAFERYPDIILSCTVDSYIPWPRSRLPYRSSVMIKNFLLFIELQFDFHLTHQLPSAIDYTDKFAWICYVVCWVASVRQANQRGNNFMFLLLTETLPILNNTYSVI